MRILIKTPLHNNSKYIPHLIEHCVGKEKNMDPSLFLKYHYEMDATSFLTYTDYEIPNYTNVEKFIELLMKPLFPVIIKKEVKVLKEELGDQTYKQDLLQKIGVKLYGKSFNNNRTEKVDIEDVIEYHKRHYRTEAFIITDDDFFPIVPINQKEELSPCELGEVSTIQVTHRKFKNQVLILPLSNWKNFFFMDFLSKLLYAHFEYTERYMKFNYSIDDAFFYITHEHVIVSYPVEYDTGFSPDFFNLFKKQYLDILFRDYGRKSIILCFMFLWEIITEEELGKFLDTLSFKELKRIIQKVD